MKYNWYLQLLSQFKEIDSITLPKRFEEGY